MNTSSPDPDYLRTKAAYHHLVHILDTSLPPPIPDTPESRAERNQTAITQIAALCPANPAEAALAAQFVAATAQAFDCLRLTHDPETPPNLTLKCNAQAASMMRQAQGAMNTLLRVQAARRKQDPDTAAWSEYTATQMMTEKLTDLTHEAPPPQPAPEPPEPETYEPPATQDPTDTYIFLYPDRAGLIRRTGGMPPDATFPPPDEATIRALVTGNTPAMRVLDRIAA